MKISVQYASFFNRGNIAFVNKKVIEKCNNILYKRSGIYEIINKINGYRYIGKSKNITIRLWQHKSLLRNNRHVYRTGEKSLLQKAWNKYGEENFLFKVIEFCEVEKLNEREQYWIDYYKCNHTKYRQGYNVTDGGEGAYSNQNIKGRIRIHNGEIQKIIRPEDFDIYEKKGYVRGNLPSIDEKIMRNKNPAKGEYHWAYGKKFSEEHRRKISESNKGKSSWMKGRHWSEEYIEMFRKNSTGRKHTKEAIEKIIKSKEKPIVQYSKNGEKISEYISGKDAENKTGIARSHISQCCNGKRNTAGGYKWRFKYE